MDARPPSPESRTGATLTVDLAAIAENWLQLDSQTGDSCDCGAVIKANAYGLGMDQVAPALLAAGCNTFFVAYLDEGIQLRGAIGNEARIIVMHGPHQGTEREFSSHSLIPVLNTVDQIDVWKRYAAASNVSKDAVVQIDTGMNRLGLTPQEFDMEMKSSDSFHGVIPLALMSHLACADTPADDRNRQQREAFEAALSLFRKRFPFVNGSLANSSGIFLGSSWHYDLVRPGAALFGINPQLAEPNPMKPVVRLHAKIVQVRRVDLAGTVGYGATYPIRDGGKLATVSIGYADGFLSSLSSSGTARLCGYIVPVAGRVSMDLLTFDVSDVPDHMVSPGTSIEIIDAWHTVDDLAREANTIGYEVLTALGTRYERRYIPYKGHNAKA